VPTDRRVATPHAMDDFTIILPPLPDITSCDLKAYDGLYRLCIVNTLVRPGAGWKKISREMRIGVGTSYRLSAEGSKTRERVS